MGFGADEPRALPWAEFSTQLAWRDQSFEIHLQLSNLVVWPKSLAPALSPHPPDRGETSNPGPGTARCLGGAFAGAVAPGAGAGRADGGDAIPVFGAADQAGVGAVRELADVALGPGTFGGGGAFGDVGLDAALDGVPVVIVEQTPVGGDPCWGKLCRKRQPKKGR